MRYGIIYKATCLENNKSYIGQTIRDFSKYKKEHIRKAYKSKSDSSRVFYKAIRKYGSDNFSWDILEECYNQQELDSAETKYIQQYRTYVLYEDCSGYNMSEGAEPSFAGQTHSDENKKLFSDNMKEKWNNPKWREKQLIRINNRSRRSDAAKMVAIDPQGNVIELNIGLGRFCAQQNLPFTTIRNRVNKGKIHFTRKLQKIETMNAEGWEFISDTKYYS